MSRNSDQTVKDGLTAQPGSPASNPAPSPPTARRGGWSRALLWIGVTAVLVGGACFLAVLYSVQRGVQAAAAAPANLVQQTGDAVAKFLEALQTRTVRTQFIAYATKVQGQQRLQVGEIQQTALLTKESTSWVWKVPLPDVVVEARYPVRYTYYLELADGWDFQLEGTTLRVTAPPLACNEPAIDVSQLELRTIKSSVLREEASVAEELRQEITWRTRLLAREAVPLVREPARRETEAFVRRWLLTLPGVLGPTPAHPVRTIEVRFRDEVESPAVAAEETF